MAYIINQPAPPAVIIEQPPPPVIFQPAPPAVIIEQPPPPVIIQPAPPPAIIHAQPAVIVQPPGPVVIQSPMKALPASVRCRYCQQQIVTVTRPINGLLTWTVFGTLLVCLIWPFCLIPLFVSCYKDIEHTCPNCMNVIHVYKRL